MRRISSCLLALLLAGCTSFEDASSGAPPSQSCVPGQQIDCPCPDDAQRGVQSCLPDGSGFGACQCSSASGGSGGAGSGPFGGAGGERAGAGSGGGGAGQAGQGGAGAGQGGSAGAGDAGGPGGGAGPGAGAGGMGAAGAGGGGAGQAGQGGAAGSAGSGAGAGGSPGKVVGANWYGAGDSCDGCLADSCLQLAEACLELEQCVQCSKADGPMSVCPTTESEALLGCASALCGSPCGLSGAGGAGGAGGSSGSSGQGGSSSCGDNAVEGGEVCDDAGWFDSGLCSGSCGAYCAGPSMYFNPKTASCYRLIDVAQSNQTAEEACQKLAPEFGLATLASPDESAFVQQKIPIGDGVWVGGARSVMGQWLWLYGETWSVPDAGASWSMGEPSLAGNCLILTQGGLVAQSCIAKQMALCERVPKDCDELANLKFSTLGAVLTDSDGPYGLLPQKVSCP